MKILEVHPKYEKCWEMSEDLFNRIERIKRTSPKRSLTEVIGSLPDEIQKQIHQL